MTEFISKVQWRRAPSDDFLNNRYSRGHQWIFDGGVTVQASASPHIVPIPYAIEANVDPEEAFVAAVSSCHMLFLLAIAAKNRYLIDAYLDEATGTMAKDVNGRLFIDNIKLKPKITLADDQQKPSIEQLEKMHHQAHQQCFIANSIITKVVTEISPL